MKWPQSLGKRLGCFAACSFLLATAQAGPLEELKSVAQLPPVDLAKLKSGEILTQRSADTSFARGISVESAYFIPAPPEAVSARLLHWDPTKHPKMQNRLYREYPLSKPGDAFSSLELSSRLRDDQWILDQVNNLTEGGSADDLHLTAAEIALIRKEVPKKGASSEQARLARINSAWAEIFRGRSDSLASGGIGAVAPYSADGKISPGSEFRGLLSTNSSAQKHFRPILEARPLRPNGSAPDDAVGYWETSIVRGHTTLQLGLFAGRKNDNGWQLVDCVYYPTDTYFMALDLFQLWPVEGGTLVWQVGFVSAPFRSYLGGVDRYVAGKQMVSETIETIKEFRADFPKR